MFFGIFSDRGVWAKVLSFVWVIFLLCLDNSVKRLVDFGAVILYGECLVRLLQTSFTIASCILWTGPLGRAWLLTLTALG